VKGERLEELTAACARCGACRAVCTLYPERRSEGAVARGKIALVQAALGGRNGDARAVREALADCLLCGRCERACPNGVAYEEIAMRGRAALAEELGVPAWRRVLLGGVARSPRAAAAARAAAAGAQRLLPGRIPTASGLHYRFPEGLSPGGRTLPRLPARGFTESLPRDEGHPTPGSVLLFTGCVFDHVFPEVGRAAYETVKATGAPVAVLREAACCGLPAMTWGDWASARSCAAGNLRRIREAAPAAVVFPCGSCLLMFRRNLAILFPEGDPLHEEALFAAERAVDYAEFVAASGLLRRAVPPPAFCSVGYHDPCHLSGTLGKGPWAREVLRAAAGRAFAEMPGADLCCGYGGSFNLRDYGASAAIGERKIRAAAAAGTGVVATACSGCLLQLRDMAARAAPSLQVVHVAQLLARALPCR